MIIEAVAAEATRRTARKVVPVVVLVGVAAIGTPVALLTAGQAQADLAAKAAAEAAGTCVQQVTETRALAPIASKGALTPAQIAQAVVSAGFPANEVETAVAVAMAESSGVPTATNRNTNGSTDYGLFQINSIHSGILARGTWSSPVDNAVMALKVWRDAGGSWSPWVTYKTGAYRKYMGTSVPSQNVGSVPLPVAVNCADPQIPSISQCGGNDSPISQPSVRGKIRTVNESGMQPNARALGELIKREFPTVLEIGGYRPGDPQDHGQGLAVDVMVSRIGTYAKGQQKVTGDKVAAWAKANAASLGITYVIWENRIWNIKRDGEGWRSQGKLGATDGHWDHVHISVKRGGSVANAPQIVAHADVTKFANGQIPTEYLCPLSVDKTKLLRADAADAFNRLSKAYKGKFGSDICVTDAYRSLAEQIDVKRRKPKLAAAPGTSNHGLGLAVDLGCGAQTFGTPVDLWLRANAPSFGWVHPKWADPSGSKPEPWHWEYASGVTAARR